MSHRLRNINALCLAGGLSLSLLAGCSFGPSQEEMSLLDQRRQAVEAREKMVDQKKAEKARLERKLAEKKAEQKALADKLAKTKSNLTNRSN